MLNQIPTYPDLIVEDIAVTEGGLAVTIRNAGDAPVTNAFWVDLYVNPNPPPDAINQIWSDLSGWGGVWGVTGIGLPLLPGGSLSLQVGGPFYDPNYSVLPAVTPAGTILYAQVDSYNQAGAFGAVEEGHEIRGEAYNNIFGPYTLPQQVELAPPAQREQDGESSAGSDLPHRSLRQN